MGALTTANNAVAATQATVPVPAASNNHQPSVIIVEVIGYGGGDASSPPQEQKRPANNGKQGYNYDPNTPVQIVGHGSLSEAQMRLLTAEERAHKMQASNPDGM